MMACLAKSLWFGLRLSWRIRHLLLGPNVILWMRYTHQPAVEPVHNVLEPFDSMPRFARSREFMTFSRKHHHGRRPLQKFECPEQLFTARVGWRPVIGLAKNEHHWRVDVLDERDRGTVNVILRVLEGRSFEPVRLEKCEVGRVPPGGPVGNVSLGNRRCKATRMSDGPIGENATPAASGHAQFLGIDVATLQQFVYPDHQVAIVISGIVILNYVSEVLPVAGGTARVHIKYNVAFRRHPLKLVIKDPPVRGMRATVNIQNQGILSSRVKVGWLLDPALDAFSVEACVIEFFGISHIQLGPERMVHIGNSLLRTIGPNREQVADHDRGGDKRHDSPGIRGNRKIKHSLIATG